MKKILTFILFCCAQVALAQQVWSVEDFRQLSTTDQRFDFLSDSNIRQMDKSFFEQLLPIIQEKSDDKSTFYWHFQYYRFADYFKIAAQEDRQKIFAEMTQIAQKKGLKTELIVVKTLSAIGDLEGNPISEQQAYSTYLSCFEQIKLLGYDQFKRYTLDQILYAIGRNFYELGDTEKALECLLASEKLTNNKVTIIYTLTLNLIETIYAKGYDYNNAISYAQKIHDINYQLTLNPVGKTWERTFWQGLSYLNIANYMYEMGNINECEKYADQGYQLSKIDNDFSESPKVLAEFEALQVLIRVKLRLGKLNEVGPLFQRVELLKPHIGSGMESNYFKPLSLYRNYTQYYEARKDYSKAYHYLKLANELQDSLNRRNDKRTLWQTEMRVNADRYQQEIKSAEAESSYQAQLRNAAIIALFLFGAFAFVTYRRIKQDNSIIAEQKTLLEKSLSEKETLLKEIHHRVKNNLQIISGLLEKQANKTDDAMTKKLMKEGQDRVFSMALVHHNLYQSQDLSAIEIKSYLQMLVQNIQQSHQTEDCKVQLISEVDDTIVNIDTAIPLGLILNELITNAFKYAFAGKKEGTIKIVFKAKNNHFWGRIADNGIGLPPAIDLKQTSTMGMNLVRGLVRQLDGTLQVNSDKDGTVFEILIPQ